MRPHHDAAESRKTGQEAQSSGGADYDEQDAQTQARTRESWDAETERAIADLDLPAEFRAAGRSWTEADEDGRVIRRG